MSYSKNLFLLTAFVLCFLTGFGKNNPEEDFKTCVTELNARCPIEHTDGWAILSFNDQSDTTRIELAYPNVLGGFLPSLTVNTKNAKQLWVRQMHMFGEEWKAFVRKLIAARRTLVLVFTLDAGEPPVATIALTPEDFN